MSRDIQALAGEMSAAFETRNRESGEDYLTIRDGSPQWMKDVCRFAHRGDSSDMMLPDDWRYRFIAGAVEYLSETGAEDDDDFADSMVPDYNVDRLNWLGSHGERPAYVDEAKSDDADIMTAIGQGIYAEALEVFALVHEALTELAEVQ